MGVPFTFGYCNRALICSSTWLDESFRLTALYPLALCSHTFYGETAMSQAEYPERPWHLVILLSNATSRSIAQYRNRQDAEDNLRTIQRLAPNAEYTIVFVPPSQPGEIHDSEL
jgi:hypothetical protein